MTLKPKVGDKVHIEGVVTEIEEESDNPSYDPFHGDPYIAVEISGDWDTLYVSKNHIVKVIPREFQIGDFVKVPFSQQRLTILNIHGDYYWLFDETSLPGTYHKQYVTRWED